MLLVSCTITFKQKLLLLILESVTLCARVLDSMVHDEIRRVINLTNPCYCCAKLLSSRSLLKTLKV